ncbi:restriction endonuclease subunit S [Simplicispira sedimenti]|uniref:restriction endonuclease subunit S n=1 Tax=Simplicispira sedimenti TaxID=2919500 RepID=UPI001FAAD8D7|nr:restriction endonuclease subunit S [Acidovorax sp. W1-6]
MLLSNMELLATAPGGVAKLRELILTLAVQGKLVPQDPADEPAAVLLQKIRAEKDRLMAEGKIKRDKPLAEIGEEEKPFDLPQGWEWVRLSALLQKIGAGSTPLGGREVYVSSGVKFLRSQNVWDEGLRLDGVAFIKPETHARMAGTVVVANDLLFNITGASIGRCAVVPSDFDEANVSQHVTIIRAVLPEINAYLHKVLVSRHVQQTVMDVQVGVSREGLSIAKLGQFLIPLPPLAEQSRIVTRVEALMRLCDALEAKGQLEAAQHVQLVSTLLGTLTASTTPEELAANWQRVAQHFDLLLDRPEAIDALEQTLLQLAVRGLLVPQDPSDEPASALLQKIRAEKDRLIATGQIKRDKPLPPITDEEKPFELPVGWEWVRLADIADSRLGKMLDKAKNSGRRYPYLRNTNVQWHHIDLDDIKEISLEASELAEFRLMAGDLLICEGGYPGRCAIWRDPDREMYFQKALHRVRPRGGIAVELIAIALESDSRAGSLDKHFTGATIKHFVGQALDRYVLALPPLPEQSRIVTRVTALRRLCADLRQRLAERQSVQARLAEALVDSVTA